MSRSLFRLALAFSLAMGIVCAQQGEEVRVIVHWKMNNTGGTTIEDSSGNNLEARIMGEAAFAADAQMPSVEVFGPSGYITAPYSDELEPAIGGVETWIKPKLLKDMDIFSKLTFMTLRSGYWGGKAVYGVHLYRDGNVGGYILNDQVQRGWTWVESHKPVISLGEWHHVLLQWTDRHVTLYVDGVQIARQGYMEIPYFGLSYSREGHFTLGASTVWHGTADHQFIGQFGETRIFGGEMAESEIKKRAARTPE